MLGRLRLEPWDHRPGRADGPRARDDAWPRSVSARIAVLARHPVLIQRPILLLDDDTAVLRRTEPACARPSRSGAQWADRASPRDAASDRFCPSR